MIYTITFNPSLDYIIQVDDFKTGVINRTHKELILAGGKGINVSVVLGNLGHDSTALGFIGGFTGQALKSLLISQGVKNDFIEVQQGFSRINVKMKSDNETEINGQGPVIEQEHIDQLFEKLDAIKDGDTLVISGSIPSHLPDDMYQQILQRLSKKEIRCIVDATKDLLMNVLKYKPYLIKPNNLELSEIFGVDLQERDDVIPYAKKLQEMGAQNVLVSMAGKGAVLVAADGQVLQMDAPKGQVVNSVGAGDSMVAGFLAGMLETNDYHTALEMGICCGSVSAFSDHLATRSEVQDLMKKLKEEEERAQ